MITRPQKTDTPQQRAQRQALNDWSKNLDAQQVKQVLREIQEKKVDRPHVAKREALSKTFADFRKKVPHGTQQDFLSALGADVSEKDKAAMQAWIKSSSASLLPLDEHSAK